MVKHRKSGKNEGVDSGQVVKKTCRKTFSNQHRMALTKKDALRILKSNFGNISMTCEQVGVSRQTFYKWRNDDAVFNEEVEAIQERTLDFVESKMIQGINDGNTRLIIFYLSCKGKKRGYGFKSDADVDKNNSITLRISSDEMEY